MNNYNISSEDGFRNGRTGERLVTFRNTRTLDTSDLVAPDLVFSVIRFVVVVVVTKKFPKQF